MAAVDDSIGEGAGEGWGEDAELIIDEGNYKLILSMKKSLVSFIR